MSARVATAIGRPPSDPVRTAPRGVLDDLYFMRRRTLIEELAVICDLRQLVRLDVFEGVGERHVSVRMVMTVRLAVGCNVHQLRPLAKIAEPAQKSRGKR